MTTRLEAVTEERLIVHVGLFERFAVTVGGAAVPDAAWSRRSAAALVKVLALAPGRRLHREQVIDALWPETSVEVAAARLHKAAHYARRALGRTRGVTLVHDMVSLVPDAEVVVDVLDFCARAEEALRVGAQERIPAALAHFGGEVLPEDRYETWADDVRERVARLHGELLAKVSPEASRPMADTEGGRQGRSRSRLAGRRAAGDAVRTWFARTEQVGGGTLLVSGPAGVGKSAVLDLTASMATRRGWQVGRGVASALESPWAHAPVLEAVADLVGSATARGVTADDDPIYPRLEGGEARDDDATRARLFPAVERLLLEAAARQPVLLVVDDVDEADVASVRLLHYLARRAAGHRVLFVLAHRGPAEGVSGQLRDSLLSRGLAEALPLAPLTAAAAERLVRDRFPGLGPAPVSEVVAAGAGLPYALLQLGQFVSGGGASLPSPRLPDPVSRTLRRATELGETFEATELAARAGIATAEARRRLAAAEAASLLEAAPTGHRFRHPLLRRVFSALPDVGAPPPPHGPLSLPAARRPVRRPACRGRGDGLAMRRRGGAGWRDSVAV